jgi:uncharacterized protein YkwD
VLRRSFARIAASFAAAAALSAVGAVAPAPASAFTTTSNGVRLDAVEYRLAVLINQARTSRGIPALTVAPGTTDLARDWSMNQARKDTLYHNPNLVSGVQTHGSYDWRAVAENVGRGWSADSLFTAYMNSPPHRANILDRSMRYLGIGWVERPDGSGYNTQVFVDQYSSAYGHSRRAAVGGLADVRTPSVSTTVASFENGWDPRVLVTYAGSGIAVAGPLYDGATAGDDGAVFKIRETAGVTASYAELRVRDALDLRNAKGVRVKLSATTGTGKAVVVQVFARRELGTSVGLGSVVVPSGAIVTVTLPVPASAKNFRNALGFAVTAASLNTLSPVLAGRTATIRVRDVAVMV